MQPSGHYHVDVDIWMELPDRGAWLTRATLEEIGAAAAKRCGVTIAA